MDCLFHSGSLPQLVKFLTMIQLDSLEHTMTLITSNRSATYHRRNWKKSKTVLFNYRKSKTFCCQNIFCFVIFCRYKIKFLHGSRNPFLITLYCTSSMNLCEIVKLTVYPAIFWRIKRRHHWTLQRRKGTILAFLGNEDKI